VSAAVAPTLKLSADGSTEPVIGLGSICQTENSWRVASYGAGFREIRPITGHSTSRRTGYLAAAHDLRVGISRQDTYVED
jgi:hypothetical protein